MNAGEVAGSIRSLAGRAAKAFPDHVAHEHLRDAANALDLGLHHGATRHLNAAIASLTPQNLHRSGIADDDHHIAGKMLMHSAHRHLLLVKDLPDQRAAMASDQKPPTGPSDRTAEGPASPDPSGNYRFVGRAGGIELAQRAKAAMGL